MSLVIFWLWLSGRVVASCCGRSEVGWCLVRGRVASCPGLWSLSCVVCGCGWVGVCWLLCVCGVFFVLVHLSPFSSA
jgi:hypothetical protein